VATVPVPPTILAGDIPSGDDWDAVLDCLTFALNKPAAKLRQTVAQTLADATFTGLTFTTEDLDSDPTGAGGHSTSSVTSRFVAVYAGWYRLEGGCSFATNATNQRGSRWAVNGTAVNASAVLLASVGAGTVVPARGDLVFLAVGDYVELQGYQNRGGTLDTFISAEYSPSATISWDRNA
jgi:hypothetical protein